MAFQLSKLKTRSKIILGICSPMVLLVIIGGISVASINSIVETDKWVDHTHEVLNQAAAVTAAALDQETGMRGYLLAGKTAFLQPYLDSVEAFDSEIDSLRKKVSDNPAQVARLDEAERVLHEWQARVAVPTIELRSDIGNAETMNNMAALVAKARGKFYFDRFREQIATFISRETILLNQRRDEFQTARSTVQEGFGQIKETNTWVKHTYKVLATVSQLLANAVDMETGMRGYMLAGEDSFLEPYHAGKVVFLNNLHLLRRSVADNPAQVTHQRPFSRLDYRVSGSVPGLG